MLQCQLMMTIRAYVRCTLCVHLVPHHHIIVSCSLYIVLLEMMMNVETDSFATNDIMNTPESSRKKKARTISSSLIIVLLVTSCIIWSIFSSSGSGSSLKAPSQRRMLREYGPDYRPIMHTFCK